MKQDTKELFQDLQDHYTVEEAKATIDALLRPFGEGCVIQFRQNDAEILDSFKVNSLSIRYIVCEIIARTGLTQHSYEDMSAEWRVHNVSYDFHYNRAGARDVSLDFHGDPRKSVRMATAVFDALDLE